MWTGRPRMAVNWCRGPPGCNSSSRAYLPKCSNLPRKYSSITTQSSKISTKLLSRRRNVEEMFHLSNESGQQGPEPSTSSHSPAQASQNNHQPSSTLRNKHLRNNIKRTPKARCAPPPECCNKSTRSSKCPWKCFRATMRRSSSRRRCCRVRWIFLGVRCSFKISKA